MAERRRDLAQNGQTKPYPGYQTDRLPNWHPAVSIIWTRTAEPRFRKASIVHSQSRVLFYYLRFAVRREHQCQQLKSRFTEPEAAWAGGWSL
jgi:hypothetical protein